MTDEIQKAVTCLQKDVAVIKDRGVRIEDMLKEVIAEQKSVRSVLDRADGAKASRGVIGHIITGAVAVGAALMTMWSGVFNSGHHPG